MNRGFLDSRGRNTNHRKKTNTELGTGSFTKLDGILNDASPLDASAAKNIVSPPVILEHVAKEKQSSVVDVSMPNVEKTGLGSYPPLPTHETNLAENGPWFIRNHPLILKNSNVNLLKEDVGNVPVWVKLHGVPVTAFSEIGLSAIAIKLGTPLMLDSYTSDMCLQSWGRSTYARAMIELRADVELKDTIVVATPKITREGYYTCTVHVEYDWKPLRKLEKLIIYGKATFVDDAGKSLKKVKYPDDHDSEDEVESVDNDMARSMASERVDLYDDDMYEGQDIPDKIQDICDNLDIRVRGLVKEKQSSLVDTSILDVENTDLRSYPPLPTQSFTLTCNAHGKSLYANITGKPSGKKVNVRTLFTLGGNGIDMVVPFSSIDRLDAMLENGPWFIQNNPLILKKWHPDENLLKEDVITVPGRSSYARVMIKLRADVELNDNIVVAMPKITREGYYTCNVRVEYQWKPPRCSSCKVFGHIHEECPKNTGAGEKKTVKKPSQTSQGVSVGPKMGYKPQKEYRPVPKKPNAILSGNKKKCVEPTIGVSNSNPFDVLNSVDNDVEFGKLRLLDNDENPLVPTGIMESDSEVGVVFYETANLRISTSGKDGSDKGYNTNSLLEQWMDSYPNNDDYDLYDDDMYKNNDLFEHLQSICDDLDIMIRGRKKK
nr:hypothetical protein [Tanacetum cinerariifolium]